MAAAAAVIVAALSLLRFGQPEPTALEQVEVERIWSLPQYSVATNPGTYAQFAYLTWQGDRSGNEPGVGTLLADIMESGVRGSEAQRVPRNKMPDDDEFVGAPQPGTVYRIAEGRRILLASTDDWDWSVGPFMILRGFAAAGDHKRRVEAIRDPEVETEWWPTRGAASDDMRLHGQIVPTRDAIVFQFASSRLSNLRNRYGSPGQYAGPYEFIVEDHTTGTPRLVGFRLEGEDPPPPESLKLALDGSWAIAFDSKNMRAWFLPLHLAWDYLDSTQPAATTDVASPDDGSATPDP